MTLVPSCRRRLLYSPSRRELEERDEREERPGVSPATLVPSCRRRFLSSPRRRKLEERGEREGQMHEEEEALAPASSTLPAGASAWVAGREESKEREGADGASGQREKGPLVPLAAAATAHDGEREVRQHR